MNYKEIITTFKHIPWYCIIKHITIKYKLKFIGYEPFVFRSYQVIFRDVTYTTAIEV